MSHHDVLNAAIESADRYADLCKVVDQQNTKIDTLLDQLQASIRTREKEIKKMEAQVTLSRALSKKAENMNIVHDFISSFERLFCRRFNIDYMPLARALTKNAIDWGALRTELDIPDASEERLVTTINKIKSERIELGHASKVTAEELELATSLLPISIKHFGLSDAQADMMSKILQWILTELPAKATLLDLREKASFKMSPEEFLESCMSVMKQIATGDLRDTYVNEVYRFDAWNAFDGIWRSNNDSNQLLLTPYQRNVLGEFWFILENSDANPEAVDLKEADWAEVQRRAARMLAMLQDDTADQQDQPFESWIMFAPRSVCSF